MDKYRIIEKLNGGSGGTVFKICRLSDKRELVLKRISLIDLDSPARAQARLEVDLMQQLHHPHIVPYHDAFVFNDEDLCIVMEYLSGGDLGHIVDRGYRGPPLTERRAMMWLVQMSLALHYLHSHSIVHRDLKTQNIFLDSRTGHVMIGDFGVAHILENAKATVETPSGTPLYMAPEILQGNACTFKCDVWSLGCIMYELLCGKHPFAAHDLSTLIIKVVRGNYPPIPQHYSRQLARLVDRLLERDPRVRPQIDEILTMPFVATHVRHYLSTRIPTESPDHPSEVVLSGQIEALGFSVAEHQAIPTELQLSVNDAVAVSRASPTAQHHQEHHHDDGLRPRRVRQKPHGVQQRPVPVPPRSEKKPLEVALPLHGRAPLVEASNRLEVPPFSGEQPHSQQMPLNLGKHARDDEGPTPASSPSSRRTGGLLPPDAARPAVRGSRAPPVAGRRSGAAPSGEVADGPRASESEARGRSVSPSKSPAGPNAQLYELCRERDDAFLRVRQMKNQDLYGQLRPTRDVVSSVLSQPSPRHAVAAVVRGRAPDAAAVLQPSVLSAGALRLSHAVAEGSSEDALRDFVRNQHHVQSQAQHRHEPPPPPHQYDNHALREGNGGGILPHQPQNPTFLPYLEDIPGDGAMFQRLLREQHDRVEQARMSRTTQPVSLARLVGSQAVKTSDDLQPNAFISQPQPLRFLPPAQQGFTPSGKGTQQSQQQHARHSPGAAHATSEEDAGSARRRIAPYGGDVVDVREQRNNQRRRLIGLCVNALGEEVFGRVYGYCARNRSAESRDVETLQRLINNPAALHAVARVDELLRLEQISDL